MDRALIKQGDTLPWGVRPNTLGSGVAIDNNWSCREALYTDQGVEVIAPRGVTLKQPVEGGDEHFIPALSNADTESLEAGVYHWAIEVSNSTVEPEYNDESLIEVTVEAQLLPSA